MSHDNAMAQEIPDAHEEARVDVAAIDRDEAGRDPLIAAPLGAPLSVLWWGEAEAPTRG